MRLVRIGTSDGDRYGLIDDGHVVVAPGPIADLAAVVADLDGFATTTVEHGERIPISAAKLLSPLAECSQFIGVGLNYRDHAIEAGLSIPEAPITFTFWPASICGPGDPIVIPPFSTKVDWEAELAVVIGKGGSDIPLDRAMQHVAGYTIVNDVTDRQIQDDEGQWGRAKSLNTFKPMGPWIVTADELGDGSGLQIELWVNDVLKQSSSTDELVFSVPELVSRLSASATLVPGAVISTGTPPGVGHARTPAEYLTDGDLVRVAVEGIGELVNPVCRA